MKTKKILIIALLSPFVWSCTTQNAPSGSLKSAINTDATTLSTAVNTITASSGYQALAVNTNSAASAPSLVKSSIIPFDTTTVAYSLPDVAGIWDYAPAWYNRRFLALNKFFTNSGTSSDFIVRMPASKVKNPWMLFIYRPVDTTLVNNYVIDVNKYDRNYRQYRRGGWYWTYDMASNISLSDVNAGNLAIQSSNQPSSGYHFNSTFAFPDGYNVNTSYASGDTIVSVYTISKNNSTLYQEKYTAIKTSPTSRFREKQYSLTIGNVEIVRTPGPNSLDSAKVYLAGVLQTNAKVAIVDESTNSTSADSTETTITNHKREIQITFDDGTVTTISQLLSDNTLSNIRQLFATIRQSYFATDVVDALANYIYDSKH